MSTQPPVSDSSPQPAAAEPQAATTQTAEGAAAAAPAPADARGPLAVGRGPLAQRGQGGPPRGGPGGGQRPKYGPPGQAGGGGRGGPGGGKNRPPKGPRGPRGPQQPGADGQAAAPESAADLEQREDAAREAQQQEAQDRARQPRSAVPVPNRREKLSAELEAEIQAALGDISLDEVATAAVATNSTAARLPNETRTRGQVADIHGDDVFVTLGGKNQGVLSLRQFPAETQPKEGDVFDVMVTGYNTEDDLHILSLPGGTVVSGNWSDVTEGALVEARVTGANAGGLECSVGGLPAFIPISQISLYRVENTGEYINTKLVCIVTEANERRGNMVLSRRAVLEREKEESKKQLLAELQPGEVREGTVRKIQDFGAFIDLGGVDGLLHVSQLSWERVSHPSELLTEGQKIRVRIERIDPDTHKISLSLKNPEEHPWKDIGSKFPVGMTAKGTVSRLAQFGAFVKLAPGVEGLVHISELAHHKVYAVQNVVQEGQEVEVKVLTVDEESQRMSLSLKAALPAPQKKDKDAKPSAEPADEPQRAPIVAKRGGPLKGGTGKGTGGDKFGLNW